MQHGACPFAGCRCRWRTSSLRLASASRLKDFRAKGFQLYIRHCRAFLILYLCWCVVDIFTMRWCRGVAFFANRTENFILNMTWILSAPAGPDGILSRKLVTGRGRGRRRDGRLALLPLAMILRALEQRQRQEIELGSFPWCLKNSRGWVTC